MTKLTDKESENIKALKNTELCVCHIQSDCPTHPKGDFGVMTDTEINKACAKLMGKKHHVKIDDVGLHDRFYICSCGKKIRPAEWRFHKAKNLNPLNNKSDAYDLIQYVVNEWDGWNAFRMYTDASLTMLISNMRALPEALAIYEKEGK